MTPTLLLAALCFGFQAPASAGNAAAFVLSFVIALAISFAVACLVGMLGFYFLAFVPAATWMGELSGAEIARSLALGLGWSAALLGLCWWLWSRIVHRLVVQGG